MAPQLKKASYRQRVYQNSAGNIELIFGDAPAPQEDGVDMKLLADHDVTETISVVDHVEASAVPAEVTPST